MTENMTSEFVASHSTRAQIYRWLSTLFAREIDQETLDLYRHGAGQVLLKALSKVPALQPEVKTLQRLLAQEDDTAVYAVDLAGAYGFLFLGAGGPQSVPPYESVYTSQKGSMYQEAERQTLEMLKECGLGVSRDIHEPTDHIAIQLELMGRLAELSVEASQTDAQRAGVLIIQQKRFLEEHLLKWVPEFSAHCAEHDPSGFYAAVARLMTTILAEDKVYLERL